MAAFRECSNKLKYSEIRRRKKNRNGLGDG